MTIFKRLVHSRKIWNQSSQWSRICYRYFALGVIPENSKRYGFLKPRLSKWITLASWTGNGISWTPLSSSERHPGTQQEKVIFCGKRIPNFQLGKSEKTEWKKESTEHFITDAKMITPGSSIVIEITDLPQLWTDALRQSGKNLWSLDWEAHKGRLALLSWQEKFVWRF